MPFLSDVWPFWCENRFTVYSPKNGDLDYLEKGNELISPSCLIPSLLLPAAEPVGGPQGRDEDEEQERHPAPDQDAGERQR